MVYRNTSKHRCYNLIMLININLRRFVVKTQKYTKPIQNYNRLNVRGRKGTAHFRETNDELRGVVFHLRLKTKVNLSSPTQPLTPLYLRRRKRLITVFFVKCWKFSVIFSLKCLLYPTTWLILIIKDPEQ